MDISDLITNELKKMNPGGPSTPQRMYPVNQMGTPNQMPNQPIRPAMPTQNPALFNNVIYLKRFDKAYFLFFWFLEKLFSSNAFNGSSSSTNDPNTDADDATITRHAQYSQTTFDSIKSRNYTATND